MRRLVSVRTVDSLEPIDGADAIETAMVGGWCVVVKKGEFSPGDLGVFFEIDSFLPMDDPRFSFLHKNAIKWNNTTGMRIKSIRLRGQLSQGLILPLSVFPEISASIDGKTTDEIDLMDFTELVKVVKWEPIAGVSMGGVPRGNFPSFLAKSDQDRYQGLAKAFNKIIEHNRDPNNTVITFEKSIKLDGSSITVYNSPLYERSGVCSRNIDLVETESNIFWRLARQYKLLETLELLHAAGTAGTAGGGIAIQGEIFGLGVNGNHEGIDRIEFRIFDIYLIASADGKWPGGFVYPETRRMLIDAMNELRAEKGWAPLEQVPILDAECRIDHDPDNIMAELQASSEGASLYAPSREGVVYKSNSPVVGVGSPHQPFTFKAISNTYLLAHGDRG
jgi:RNA ligase (TIGR02306 family)